MKQRLSEWIKETIEIAEIRIKGHNGNYYHGVRDYLKEIAPRVKELEAAVPNWQRIDPERPEAMPPCNCDILLTRRDRMVIPGERDELKIFDSYTGQWEPIEGYTHWQPWPEPAPLPGGVNE